MKKERKKNLEREKKKKKEWRKKRKERINKETCCALQTGLASDVTMDWERP